LRPDRGAHGSVRSYAQPGYWRDVGTIDAYWEANMDFLSDNPPFDLDDPSWAVRTQGGLRSPAWVTDSASVRTSLLSSAAQVAGDVRHSVLAPRAVVERGATVVDSILLPGCRVRAGARVERAIVDDNVVIGSDAQVGGADAITLLGRSVELEAGSTVKAGARVPEDDDD
jgi:glucose-1-phosphate adenylyltransferase